MNLLIREMILVTKQTSIFFLRLTNKSSDPPCLKDILDLIEDKPKAAPQLQSALWFIVQKATQIEMMCQKSVDAFRMIDIKEILAESVVCADISIAQFTVVPVAFDWNEFWNLKCLGH